MTRLDIVGSFSGHAGPRRLCERYPSSHCEVTTPRDAGSCDAGGCPWGIDTVGASEGDMVRRALARLAPEYREAFLLKHVEELEYEEMAQLTGAGISALKMRVKRAREQLQVIFREAERV